MPSSLPIRSEEHTSELQSHDNLVCRLLLEKKKTTYHVTEANSHIPRAARGTQHTRRCGVWERGAMHAGSQGPVMAPGSLRCLFFLRIGPPPNPPLPPTHPPSHP